MTITDVEQIPTSLPERPDKRNRSLGFSPLPPHLKQRALGYAMAALIAATGTFANIHSPYGQESSSEPPIVLTTGPEKIGIGKPSAIFIGGKSNDPPPERFIELINVFAGALVERGIDAENLNLYAVTEDLDFPGQAEIITDETDINDLYNIISENTQNAAAPILLGMIGHGSTNWDGNFTMKVTENAIINSADLAKTFARGIQNHDRNSPVKILVVWESCESGGALVGGPDDATPFNKKGQTNLYDQILRELQRLNPTLSKEEVQKWFSLKQFAPTLPNIVANANAAFWDFIGAELSRGQTIEEAAVQWRSSELNITGEIPVTSLNQHPPAMGTDSLASSQIQRTAHSGGITLEAQPPKIADNSTLQVPLIIENYTLSPYTMTAKLIDSSGAVRKHIGSIPILVSPSAARPVTATLNIDPSALGVYTGTLELVDQNGFQYQIDFDTRRDPNPNQLVIPPGSLQPTYSSYDFDPDGFNLLIPTDQLPDGNYTAEFIAQDDVVTRRDFSIPYHGILELHSSKPRHILQIRDEAGNIVHSDFYSALPEDDTVIDAMARDPLQISTVYTGTVFFTNRIDRDIYKLPLDSKGISIALNTDPSYKYWNIHLAAYDQNGKSLGIFGNIESGDSKLFAFPQNSAYVELFYGSGLAGKESPQYSFELNDEKKKVFLPSLMR